MNYQNQNQGLPFDPQNLSSQPMQFNYNSPPFVPNNLAVNPQLQHVIVPACAGVANEISKTALNHCGRTFLYNQMSANNWSNSDFVKAVSTAIDLLFLGMVKGRYRSPEEGLEECIRQSVGLCSALNFSMFQDLARFVSQDVYQDAITNVNALQSLTLEINNAKNSMVQPQQQMNYQNNPNNQMMRGGGGYPNQNMGNQPMGMMNNGGGYPNQVPNQNFNQHQRYTPEPLSPMAANSVFSNQPARVEPQVTQALHQEGKYSYLKKTRPENNVNATSPVHQGSYFKKEPPPQQTVEPAEKQKQEVLVWESSPAQTYPVTIDPRKQKMGLKKVTWTNDKTYVVSHAIELTKEEIMDRSKHTIGIVQEALTSEIPPNYRNRTDALNDSVDKLVEKNNLVVDKNEDISLLALSEKAPALIDNFIDSVIFSGRVRMKKNGIITENSNSAYSDLGGVSIPVLVNTDLSEFMRRFDSCKTYQAICDVLMSGLTDPDSCELAAKIDKTFTEEVNSIIKNRMSLYDTITSFVEDSVPLIEHLRSTHGEMFMEAYLSCQADFTAKFLNPFVISEGISEMFVDNLSIRLEDSEDDDILPIQYISKWYSLTYLNAHSSEIGIDPFEKAGSSLIASENPLMHKLAMDIYKQQLNLEDFTVAHSLVITTDDVVYEIHRGLIGKDFFTVSKR